VSRRRALAATDLGEDVVAEPRWSEAELGERLRAEAAALAGDAEEQVLGPDPVVIERASLFLREDHRTARAVRHPFEHGPTLGRVRRRAKAV
jgi:hypothetical protein